MNQTPAAVVNRKCKIDGIHTRHNDLVHNNVDNERIDAQNQKEMVMMMVREETEKVDD